jgi:hypothetical protein
MTFANVLGAFAEMQNGYSLGEAVGRADSLLASDTDAYQLIFSRVSRKIGSGLSDMWPQLKRVETLFKSGELNANEAQSLCMRLAGADMRESHLMVEDWKEEMSEAVASGKKRSKYNGALVNNTFENATEANPAVMASFRGYAEAGLHPSHRYLVLNSIVASERKHLVSASLSGTLNDKLYKIYVASAGKPGPNLENLGKNGRVSLKFDTGSGICSEVDLGGDLETGYVVDAIDDPLGMFPEGTEVGDFLESAVVESVVHSQGQRDRGGITSRRGQHTSPF